MLNLFLELSYFFSHLKGHKKYVLLSKTGKNCCQVKFFLADNEAVIKKMQKKMGKMTFVLKKKCIFAHRTVPTIKNEVA